MSKSSLLSGAFKQVKREHALKKKILKSATNVDDTLTALNATKGLGDAFTAASAFIIPLLLLRFLHNDKKKILLKDLERKRIARLEEEEFGPF